MADRSLPQEEEEKLEVTDSGSLQDSAQQQGKKKSRRALSWARKNSSGPRSSSNLSEEDNYEARRSSRVSSSKYSQADGDSWQETLAVCELEDKNNVGKLVIRSYYTNLRTKQRAWDEPPTGASRVLPATEEMRRMAEMQLMEMQISTGAVPDTDDGGKAKKKMVFFRRKKGPKSEPKSTSDGKRKIEYKPGSFMAKATKDSKPADESMDPELQKAIALSLKQAEGLADMEDEEFEPRIHSEVTYRDDEEAMAMVMALSLSEAEATRPPPPPDGGKDVSEEEMIRRALEESKQNMAAAAAPAQQDRDLLGLGLLDSPGVGAEDRKPPARPTGTAGTGDEWMNQKMPAKPLSSRKGSDKASVNKEDYLAAKEEEMLQKALEASFDDSHENFKKVGASGNSSASTLSGGQLATASSGSPGNVALVKMSPETAHKQAGVRGAVARRLTKKKGLEDQAGVV